MVVKPLRNRSAEGALVLGPPRHLGEDKQPQRQQQCFPRVNEMGGRTKLVNSTEELVLATRDKDVRQIIVTADLNDIPSLRLLPGQSLRSSSEQRLILTFRQNTDGLRVSSNNEVGNLVLVASPERRAIWNDRTVENLGSISLHSLQTVGRVQILAKDKVRNGHVEVVWT